MVVIVVPDIFIDICVGINPVVISGVRAPHARQFKIQDERFKTDDRRADSVLVFALASSLLNRHASGVRAAPSSYSRPHAAPPGSFRRSTTMIWT